jgi:hypothetical protein
VNQRYLEEITKDHIEVIDGYCRELAEEFGYERPK